jgi:GNAT superfamily N-acetyltransferase
VPPQSTAIVRAKENECEMHLLAVRPGYRGYGLGRMLVNRAIRFAEDNNWSKMILWTQRPMGEAQRLYESSGFVAVGEMTKSGIKFLVYERTL